MSLTLSYVSPACSSCSHTSALKACGQQVMVRKSLCVLPLWEAEGHCPEHSSQPQLPPKPTRARRRTELDSAAWPCLEGKNRFSLLSYPGTVPWVGTSTLEPGPAAGMVPLAAAFQKLTNQWSFCNATSAEFTSLSLRSLRLLCLLYLELEPGQKLLVKLRNCKQKR